MTVMPFDTTSGWRNILRAATAEGLRLFFPIAALHTALWPLLWVAGWQLGLPFAHNTLPAHWHAQEMLIGSFGAALLGFLTSALPEWTDTKGFSGRPLLILAGLWTSARLIGLFGIDAAILLGGIFDQIWLVFLVGYAACLGWKKRTMALTGFVLLLATLAIAAGLLRFSMLTDAYDLAERAIRLMQYAFLGLLGLALARISVPITNRVLDPSEETSPYRPHPGRINLAPGLAGLLIAAEFSGFPDAVCGYLVLATGAAFLDRVAEGFIGREGWTFEVAGLWLSSLLAGLGLLLIGLGRIGVDIPTLGGLHLMLMGGLGLGVLQVLSIAGLLHTGQPLGFSRLTRAAILCLLTAVALRVTPEFWPSLILPGGQYGPSALAWAAAFLLWLYAYIPLLWSTTTIDQDRC
ncbi:NnrS family protein [Agrobacterium sp. Ap1]|nr:NnrS family protein [Agrobacterium sp. Ap1]